MTRSAPGHQDRCAGSALGLHRVLEPAGVLPQAAWRLDPAPVIGPDEVRIQVDRLNLDAASYRQLRESSGGSAEAMRAAVLAIVAGRGKMQNAVTGAGWDGTSEQVPCAGHAILFGRSIATVLHDDLPGPLALAVLDVCGAPALTYRVVAEVARRADAGAGPALPSAAGPVVAILGAAGKSGS